MKNIIVCSIILFTKRMSLYIGFTGSSNKKLNKYKYGRYKLWDIQNRNIQNHDLEI